MNKPHVFLGCSSEAIPIGKVIQSQLLDTADIKLFNQGLFEPGSTGLESVMTFRLRFDFAILLVTPDDMTTSRGSQNATPRDNVIFELGVMMGCLGPKKAIVVNAAKDLKLPSDLAGLTEVRVTPQEAENTVDAMVKTACEQIREAIKRQNEIFNPGLLPSTALAIGYFQNFLSRMFKALNDSKTEIFLKREVPGKPGEPPVDEYTKLDCDRTDVSFVIIIPDKPKYIKHDYIQEQRNRLSHRMSQVVIKTGTRDYPFYTYLKQDGRKVSEFFDLPTTITTSFEAIDILLGKIIGSNEVINSVKDREINNFRRALEFMLQEEFWSDRVKIESQSFLQLLGQNSVKDS